VKWGHFEGVSSEAFLGIVLEVIHSYRFTSVRMHHSTYETIDEAFRPSNKSGTYCWVNVWSCYNKAGDFVGVQFRPRGF
jgi:hypothetical protein